MTLRNLCILLLLTMQAIPGRAQSAKDDLDRWLDDNTKDMGGKSMLVVWKDGKLIYSHSIIYTMSYRQPIASCSKWYSAALVMSFVDEGKISLSDTVGKYLPVLSQHGKGNITLRQCLSHLTGIKEPPLWRSIREMRNIGSMDEAMQYMAGLPMEGAPGTVFHYSNAGLQIAGAVIEKVSGKSFETLFAERIAGPLGMRHTDFGKGRVALPAGGAYSTPEDYLNFLTMILHKGLFNGARILSEKSVAEMQVDRITPDVKIGYSPASMKTIGYGYGEWVVRPDDKTVTSPGLFGSIPWVDNDKQYCAFLMTFYIKKRNAEKRFRELKQLVDGVVDGR
ncbi:MAG TPA: serine hydrolase domain-containing protein [Puia sp.]|nr:serine hydrolase domain-containing protein [Puia sp.]